MSSGIYIPPKAPYVYIVTTDSFWPSKIGAARDVEHRLQGLQPGCWQKLHVYMALEHHRNFLIEWEVKHKLKEKKMVGEWFNVTAVEMAKILVPIYREHQNIPFDAPLELQSLIPMPP